MRAAIRRQNRAQLEYPQVRAGLILMMDRTFTRELNAIVVKTALRYRTRGVVGIAIASRRSCHCVSAAQPVAS